MRKYIIIKDNYLPYVNFSEVIENEDTIVSLEKDTKTYFILKWDVEPTFLENIEYIGPMEHFDMLSYIDEIFYSNLSED